jgi:hypothetical protein
MDPDPHCNTAPDPVAVTRGIGKNEYFFRLILIYDFSKVFWHARSHMNMFYNFLPVQSKFTFILNRKD